MKDIPAFTEAVEDVALSFFVQDEIPSLLLGAFPALFLKERAVQVEDGNLKHFIVLQDPFNGIFQQLGVFRENAQSGIIGNKFCKHIPLTDQDIRLGSPLVMDKENGERNGHDKNQGNDNQEYLGGEGITGTQHQFTKFHVHIT
jgi:hypothetical protein